MNKFINYGIVAVLLYSPITECPINIQYSNNIIIVDKVRTDEEIYLDNYLYMKNVVNEVLKPTRNIDLEFIMNIIRNESFCDSTAIGDDGERGVMQIKKDTWNELTNKNFDEAFNTRTNIINGIKYLKDLERQLYINYDKWSMINSFQKRRLITAAYNGGFTNLKNNNYDINRLCKSIKKYVKKVNKNG
jgi:soluble lytic murein transglycosylase-like protein